MKNKILQEYLNSNIKITSQEKLEQYIEYCIYKNKNSVIKGKTSHHHILPKSLFDEYSNLNENPWNGTHLLYSDHYYAHWLLTEAIDDYGQLNAFCAMHNKDMKLGRINESDLIPLKDFQKKMEERSKGYRKWVKDNPEKVNKMTLSAKETLSKEYINDDGEITNGYIERSKKFKKTVTQEFVDKNGNITSKACIIATKTANTMRKEFVDEDGSITTGYNKVSEKRKKTMSDSIWKETIGKAAKIKAKETLSKEYINDDGEDTNGYLERNKKCSQTKLSDEWKKRIGKEAVNKRKETMYKKFYDENGNLTDKNSEQAKRLSRKKILEGRWFKVLSKEGVIHKAIPQKHVHGISGTLITKTKNKTLGESKTAATLLKNKGKEKYIGAWIEEVFLSETEKEIILSDLLV
jgi:hypothetical protein